MIIELNVTNAFSKGGIPLKVDGVANIKIAGEEPILTTPSSVYWAKPRNRSRESREKPWKVI